jgi:hypothetical protein
VGARQRSPEGLTRYRFGDVGARRRARASTALAAVASLAPGVFAVVLLNKLGWHLTAMWWAVVAGLVALVLVRAVVGYGEVRRRLRELVVTVDDGDIRVEAEREGYGIERGLVAHIVEVEGALGGLRIESAPDPRSGIVTIVRVPRGGEAFGEVRARLEQWRPIERRGRQGPTVRFALGAIVVAGIFFVPFLLDDFVARSKLTAAGLVVAMWLVMRAVIRNR